VRVVIVVREAQAVRADRGPAPYVVVERVDVGGRIEAVIALSRSDALRLLDDLTDLAEHWR
jgi:hypothetical protein